MTDKPQQPSNTRTLLRPSDLQVQAGIVRDELVRNLFRFTETTHDDGRAEVRRETAADYKRDAFERHLGKWCTGIENLLRTALTDCINLHLEMKPRRRSDSVPWAETEVATALVGALARKYDLHRHKVTKKLLYLSDPHDPGEIERITFRFPPRPAIKLLAPVEGSTVIVRVPATDEDLTAAKEYLNWYCDLARDWVRCVCEDLKRNPLSAFGWRAPLWLCESAKDADPDRPGRGTAGATDRVWSHVAGQLSTAVENARFDAYQYLEAKPVVYGSRGFDGLTKKIDLGYSHRVELTQRQMECLSLRNEYGCSNAEISRRLGIDRKVVAEHLRAGETNLNSKTGNISIPRGSAAGEIACHLKFWVVRKRSGMYEECFAKDHTRVQSKLQQGAVAYRGVCRLGREDQLQADVRDRVRQLNQNLPGADDFSEPCSEHELTAAEISQLS